MMRLSYICLFSFIAISFAFDCKGKTGLFKDADNPHKFFECDNGKDTHFTCPDELVFDETENICDYGISDPKTTTSTSKPTVTNSETSSTQPKPTQTDPPKTTQTKATEPVTAKTTENTEPRDRTRFTQTVPSKTTQTDPPKTTQTKGTEPVTAKTTENTAKLTTPGVKTEPTRGRHTSRY